MIITYCLKCPTCFAESQIQLDAKYGPPELYCQACLQEHQAESVLRVTARAKAEKPRNKERII